MADPRCKNCVYFDPHTSGPMGQCRVSAPVIVQSEEFPGNGWFPIVNQDMWCGKFAVDWTVFGAGGILRARKVTEGS